jgi:molybdate transport system substrate-binding protein
MQSIVGISSMATRGVLGELAPSYAARHAVSVSIEPVGGVDAARRVQAGEAFDCVVLAADAIDKLIGSGHLLAAGRVDVVRSAVAVAVREGAPRPAIDNEEAVRRAVLDAATIGYSTGPSGTALLQRFAAWGLYAELEPKLRLAPPGVPVAQLVARGDAALGFQQRSELQGQSGIELLGDLPSAVAIVTVFSGAVGAHAHQPEAAAHFLAYLASSGTAEAKRRHGMAPA